MRFAHLSDLHLGATIKTTAGGFDDGFDPRIAPLRLAEAAAIRIAHGSDHANEAYAGVLIAGDVFDRSQHDDHAARAFTRMLQVWHESAVPVAIIAGNHDAEVRLLDELNLPPTATLLGRDEAETVVWHDLGVAVHGQSIAHGDEVRDLSLGYPAPISGLTNIGMLHTSLDGTRSKRVCAPAALSHLEGNGYDYWALGHVHDREVLGVERRVAFSGSLFSRTLQEHAEHGYLDVVFETMGAAPTLTAVEMPLGHDTVARQDETGA